MDINNIINFCIKNNYNFIVQELINDNKRIVLSFTDYYKFNAILFNVKKLKNVHIETRTIFPVDFEGYIYIYNINDWNNIINYNNAKKELNNIFWNEMHQHKNQNIAKDVQYKYAIKNNLIDIFNKIYA